MKQQTGSKNIVANVVINMWSDAARAAALEARKAESASTVVAGNDSPEGHLAAAQAAEAVGNVEARVEHSNANNEHYAAAEDYTEH